MSVFVPRFSAALALLAALWACAGTGLRAAEVPPRRVVSINLCTDQLALMLAGPGQLVSVSRLAQDPESSVMHREAEGLATNGSGAEEVYLLRPDLVLAGSFTAPATLRMLDRLGLEVIVFTPARALSDIPPLLRRMGRALGPEALARAEQKLAQFDAVLAQLTDGASARPRAALSYVNSYTAGDRSLAGDILRAAGLRNIAAEIGLDWGGTLRLEQLILMAPDLIIQGRDYPGQARAEDNLGHPALERLGTSARLAQLTDRDWICGTPNVLNAVKAMRAERLSIAAARGRE